MHQYFIPFYDFDVFYRMGSPYVFIPQLRISYYTKFITFVKDASMNAYVHVIFEHVILLGIICQGNHYFHID